jgi:hypothetical protein
MIPLYSDDRFTFCFAEDRIISRFHMEGISVGTSVRIYRFSTETKEVQELLQEAIVGENGWVEIKNPLVMRAGDGFVVFVA